MQVYNSQSEALGKYVVLSANFIYIIPGTKPGTQETGCSTHCQLCDIDTLL